MTTILRDRPTIASPPPQRARRRGWRRWLPIGAVFVVFAALVAVHAINMAQYPITFEDEATYIAHAWAALDGRLAHYTYWYDHPPGGWFAIAGWLFTTQALERTAAAVVAGREFMLLVFIGLLTATYVVCRRLDISRPWALFGCAALGLSPLATYYHRIVLLDNVSTTLAIAAFAVALSPRKRLWAYAAAGGLFGYAVYSKLTVAVLLPFVVWEVWRSADPDTRRYALAAFVALFTMTVGLWPLMALLRGELLPGENHVSIIETTVFQLLGREGTGSVLDPTSISAGVFANWLILDFWLPAVGAAAGLAALFVRRLRPYAFALVLQSAVFLRDGYLPFGYIVQLLPFLALCLAGVPAVLWERLRAPAARTRLRTVAVRGTALLGVAAFTVPLLYGAGRDWPAMLHTQLTWDADGVYRDALAWMDEHIPHDERLMVESPVWLDLVLQGRDPDDVVWFSKLGGLDPEVTADNPNGWRDFDYIVTRANPQAAEEGVFFLPEVPPAMENSDVVAAFDNPDDLCLNSASCDLEIRRLDKTRNIPMPGAPAEPGEEGPAIPMPGAPADQSDADAGADAGGIPMPGAPADQGPQVLPLPEHLAVTEWEVRVGTDGRHYLVHVADDAWFAAFGPGQLRGALAIYGEPVSTELSLGEIRTQGLLHGSVLDLFGGPNGIERYYDETVTQ